MVVTIGYLIVILSVFGGFAMGGGHVLALFQPVELLMIAGAAIGSFLVSNNWKIVKHTLKNIYTTIRNFGYSKSYFIELLSMMYELVVKFKKEGALSMEKDIDNITDSPLFNKYPLILRDPEILEFLTDYLRLIITGRIDVSQLEVLMEQDIETFAHEKEQYILAINKIADSMPAFGIVAAVMGVVHTMESLGAPPEMLGGLIAKALVGTFLGVLIGYGFIAPLASLLEHKLNASTKAFHSIRVILICMMNNFSPTIAVEFGRKTIYGNDRPNGKELETILKDVKQNKVSNVNE